MESSDYFVMRNGYRLIRKGKTGKNMEERERRRVTRGGQQASGPLNDPEKQKMEEVK